MKQYLTAVAFAVLLATPVMAQQSQTTIDSKSFYDRNGSFAGSSSTLKNNSTSFSDRDGKFSGSAIRNSDGTTSVYDARGHFTGSGVNTMPPGSPGRPR